MSKTGALLCVTLLLLAGASLANAVEINYVFQGTGTGDLGGVQFTNAAFTMTVTGDTASVQDEGGGLFVSQASSTVIDIQGFNEATFTIPTQMFDNQPGSVLGLSRSPDMADLLDLFDNAFATYDLKSSLNPVVVSDPFFGQFGCQNGCVGTDQGNLTFTDMSAITFSATTVPEPSTLVMMGAGVLGLAARLRRML